MVFAVLITLLGVIFALGMGNVSAAPGDTIYVNGNSTLGNDDWNGESATYQSGIIGPKYSIKNATGTVNTNGQIYIAHEQYKGINNTQITIDKNMTINGESQTDTIINGTGTNWIFHINPGINFTINNLTLTNATTTNNGGAIYNYGTLTVNNSTFTSNTATDSGGAICNDYGGTLTVNNSTFTSNSAAYYGGTISNDGTLTVNNSTFTSNSATYYGGAIYNSYGTVTVNNSTFTSNSATYFGGAIINHDGSVTVNGSTFTSNTATNGGAIFNDIQRSVTVNGSTFTSNTANSGGAIYNHFGTLNVSFCRIVGNTPNDIYSSGGSCDVDYNWWGSNFVGSDPVSAGRVSGASVSKWLVLTTTSDPNTINTGETSNITADLLHDQDGVYQNPTGGHVPDGIVVNFASDALGTVNPLTGTMINGEASSIFTAGLNPGISTITSTVDAETVNTDVTINENVPPVVTNTDPVNNAVNVALNKVIGIVFDRNIQLGMNPWIELYETGTGNTKTFSTNILDNVLSITPSSILALGTQYSVILHSNSITNLAGIGLTAPYTTRFTTEAAPVVTSTSPLYNAFNVALNKVIQITFDKAIQLGTNPWIELKTSNSGTIVPYTTNIIGNVLSITPNSLLNAGTKYTVILHSNSITDMQGNGLNTPYTTIFTTTLPPVVTSTSPMNNEVNVAVNKVIQINFSKAIQLGTNSWIELKNQYGQIKPYTTSINGNTLNITANAAFARGTTYTVILHSNSVTSTGGAGLTTPYTTKFTTTTT
ncbi:Ig-like domain-containing protein [Methanobacterium spitsbergense]|uniref:Ig-like domain-containing protein n=1 Tax=Methanobacterium spitsbergense TaxID=2874285 RepID=A0A8T5UUN6_9EURY|nr:Ig-like domain-containing protein [Methanobacterium spitsbergense]MBZ2164573.1 Ig-like domain-containing protein [Methanobacterium spitsbergense]